MGLEASSSSGPRPVHKAKDSVKDVLLTVSQTASDRKEILIDKIGDKVDKFGDRAEVLMDAVTETVQTLKGSITGTADDMQESWRLIQWYLKVTKYIRSNLTKENVVVLLLVLGGTSLLVSFLMWYRQRDILSKKRKRKGEERLQALALLTKKLESSEVS